MIGISGNGSPRPRDGPGPAFMLLLAVLVGGCAALPRGPITMAPAADDSCLALFQRVDAEVRASQRSDAAAARIDGFPWLRADRLLASFRDEAVDGPRFAAWRDRLATLDREARAFELMNLPADAEARLTHAWRGAAILHQLPQDLRAGLDGCRARLNARLDADAPLRAALRAAAEVPDGYRTWQRVLGLYVLTSRIARARVVALHDQLGARFGAEPAAPVVRYAGPWSGAAPGIAGLQRDALGIPVTGRSERDALLMQHAPLWLVETGGSADRPGALVLNAAGQPTVDSGRPVEYRWLSWTRFAGDTLVQLNYALWFSERPRTGVLDIVAGHLDGVVWRVTLKEDGSVLAYDSIHPCGCYYTLLPGPGHAAAPVPSSAEPVFAPRSAPSRAPRERSPEGDARTSRARITIRLESGTHYLVDVMSDADRAASDEPVVPLSPESLNALRSLPTPDGGRASAYGPDGIIAASRRLERFVLWPLGVPSAGAMRQPGRQAIAFIGRRHFDDPFLFENLLTPWRTD